MVGNLVVRSLIALLPLFVGGCVSSDTITVKRLPTYEAPANLRTFTTQQVVTEANRQVPTAMVTANDSTYSFVAYSWLQKYLAWEWDSAKQDGISYTPESFDCDDFALGFYFYLHRAASRAGVKTAPLVARLSVTLSPTTNHMLNGVVTDRGIYIVEPQPDATLRLVELSKYPNVIYKIEL